MRLLDAERDIASRDRQGVASRFVALLASSLRKLAAPSGTSARPTDMTLTGRVVDLRHRGRFLFFAGVVDASSGVTHQLLFKSVSAEGAMEDETDEEAELRMVLELSMREAAESGVSLGGGGELAADIAQKEAEQEEADFRQAIALSMQIEEEAQRMGEEGRAAHPRIRIELGTQTDLASGSVLAAEVSLTHTLAGSGLLRHVMVDFEPRN